MNIEEMKLDDIQTRKAEIIARRDAMTAELEAAEDAALDALKEEAQQLNEEERQLNEREAAIMKAAEERQKELDDVLKNGVESIKMRKENEKMEIRDSKEYIEAYAKYIRTGKDTECRELLTDNVNGVIPVPTFVGEIVAERLKASKILSRVRKMYAAGNVKVGFEYGAPAAGSSHRRRRSDR